MPTGIEIFYITCAAVGFLFTIFTALAGHHGRVGGKVGHGHGLFARIGMKLGGKAGGKLAGRGAHGHAKTGNAMEGQDTQFVTIPIFSPLTAAVFIGLFGFLGLIGKAGLNLSPTASLLFAAPISLVATIGITWIILRVMINSQSSSVTDTKDAVGLRAKVITKIEKGRLGSISYVDKGTILTLPARVDEDENDEVIERGDEVYISRTDGKTAYVRRERGSLWQ
jgi:membrane protein implicated in regulation of membrane protease activity